MSHVRKISLSIINFSIFLIFIIISVAASSFLVYFKDSESTVKTNLATIERSDTRVFLNDLSYNLNDEFSEKTVDYTSDEGITQWAKENLKYSNDISQFENIKILRVFYDQNTKKLTSNIIWTLNYDNQSLNLDANEGVYTRLVEGSYTKLGDNNIIYSKDGQPLMIEWCNVPISDIYGLNGEDKTVAGQWNPEYSKIVITATMSDGTATGKYSEMFNGFNKLLIISKILISILLIFIIFFMMYIIWREKKKIFIQRSLNQR